MENTMKSLCFPSFVAAVFLLATTVVSDDLIPIPADKAQVEAWFTANVGPLPARTATIDPPLAAAEAARKIINVPAQFKTITEAVNSIPVGNTARVIISIAPGTYTEKIKIDRAKPFVTFFGADPNAMPIIVFDGDAAQFGTFDSATIIVESDYFNAVNIQFANSALRPRGTGKVQGMQAVALRIGGDKSSFYNCRMIGFQDTLCDQKGLHFYKDCYIEGTVDFVFGDAKSLYLNTEVHIIKGDHMAMVTAQAGNAPGSTTGFSLVHCRVTGADKYAFLGRAWMPYPRVVFIYSDMGRAVLPEGWSNNNDPKNDKTVFYGEFGNVGVGSILDARYPFTKKFTEEEAKPFLCLSYIEGSKWLLPPTVV